MIGPVFRGNGRKKLKKRKRGLCLLRFLQPQILDRSAPPCLKFEPNAIRRATTPMTLPFSE